MANNIARLSISSPSKPNPSIGFGQAPYLHRGSHGHLPEPSNYYSSEAGNLTAASSDTSGYYDGGGLVGREANLSGASSPMQPQAPPMRDPQSSGQSYTQQYFTTNFPNLNNGGSGSSSARQSFSGPASPHHHSHPQYHQHNQSPASDAGPSYQSGYHRHQLPVIPTHKIPYSSSGYRLHSPNSNPNIVQMYEDESSGAGGSSAAEDYAYRYKLKV